MPAPRVTTTAGAKARRAPNGIGIVRRSGSSSSEVMYIDTMIRRYRNAEITAVSMAMTASQVDPASMAAFTT